MRAAIIIGHRPKSKSVSENLLSGNALDGAELLQGLHIEFLFVAEDDGKVIGFAHVVLIKSKPFSCLKPETALYLQDLVVTADQRKNLFRR